VGQLTCIYISFFGLRDTHPTSNRNLAYVRICLRNCGRVTDRISLRSTQLCVRQYSDVTLRPSDQCHTSQLVNPASDISVCVRQRSVMSKENVIVASSPCSRHQCSDRTKSIAAFICITRLSTCLVLNLSVNRTKSASSLYPAASTTSNVRSDTESK